jgi:hypothetical protein
MSNRREFMQMSLAASVLPVLAAPGVAPKPHDREAAWGVVVEAASPLAALFRVEASRLGLPVWEIHDDITDLWNQELWLRWKQGPHILAGVTLSTSLFCLETLARDHQMRVWFRAEHHRLRSGGVEHVVSGTPRMVEEVSMLGENWGVGFARFAAALPISGSQQVERRVLTRASPESTEPDPMVSWIIAPRSKGRVAESL